MCSTTTRITGHDIDLPDDWTTINLPDREATDYELFAEWYRLALDALGAEFSPISSPSQKGLEIAKELGRSWVNDKNQKLPRRLAAIVKRDTGKRPSPGAVGETVKLYDSLKGQEFSCRFIGGPFNWQSGDWGDAGSCYWGDRSDARGVLHDAGCKALQYRHSDGKGRAWCMPTSDGLIIFNGYGPLPLARIVPKLADLLGLSHRKISLRNQGITDGLIYINSGVGYLLHNLADDDIPSHIDLELDESLWGCYCCCEGCGDRVHEDDACHTDGSGPYCRDCCCERYFHCHYCHGAVDIDDAVCCDDEYYCQSCAERRLHRCERCEEWNSDGTNTTEDGEEWCESCCDSEGLQECNDCSHWSPDFQCRDCKPVWPCSHLARWSDETDTPAIAPVEFFQVWRMVPVTVSADMGGDGREDKPGFQLLHSPYLTVWHNPDHGWTIAHQPTGLSTGVYRKSPVDLMRPAAGFVAILPDWSFRTQEEFSSLPESSAVAALARHYR